MASSSRGLGHGTFIPVTPVQIRYSLLAPPPLSPYTTQMSQPFIEVVIEDYSGDGMEFDTFSVVSTHKTNAVEEGDILSYSELLGLDNDGIGYEILDEDTYDNEY